MKRVESLSSKFKKNLIQISNLRTKRRMLIHEGISILKLNGKAKELRCLQSNTKSNLLDNTCRNKKIKWVCINLTNILKTDFLLMSMIQDLTTWCKTWRTKMKTSKDFYKKMQWILYLKYNLLDINYSFKDIIIRS